MTRQRADFTAPCGHFSARSGNSDLWRYRRQERELPLSDRSGRTKCGGARETPKIGSRGQKFWHSDRTIPAKCIHNPGRCNQPTENELHLRPGSAARREYGGMAGNFPLVWHIEAVGGVFSRCGNARTRPTPTLARSTPAMIATNVIVS